MKLLLIILTVLQSLLTTLEQKTLVSDFSISIAEQQSQPMTYAGDLTMHGKQFALNMLSIEAAYDGKTLYMYNDDMEELSLSIPTEDELMQTNPFLYAKALLPVCELKETAIGDKTQITLLPRNKAGGIQKFVLRVTTATLLPTTVEIYEEGGKVTSLRLVNAKYTTTVPSFVIKKEGVFVNDLR